MLNLTKIHKIQQILNSSSTLNFYKWSASTAQGITPELMDKYRQGDIGAANIIAKEILKDIHGAMKYFGITESVPYQEWTDFRDKTAERIWTYTVPRYDPSQGKFSTLVFNMVNNMWKNWLTHKATKPLDVGRSLDEPIGEEGTTLGDIQKDPLALDFKSEVEAQIIESALLENIENPRHKELLELWLSEDPRMGTKERAKAVAETYNKIHPDKPIQDYRMYRIFRDEIFPLILKKFPEMASGVGWMKNPEVNEGNVEWIQKKSPKPLIEESETTPEEEEVSPFSTVEPAYRIDPQTGERTLISLNMKRKITATQEVWCHNLLTFLSIERHGKSRRIIKSNIAK